MVFKKNDPFSIAGACFAAYCVLRLFNLGGFVNVLSVLAYVFLAVMLFMRRRDHMLVIASAIPAALSLLNILINGGTSFLGFLGFVADLTIPAFVASFLLPQLEPYVGKYKHYLEKYWYVPAALGLFLWSINMVSLFVNILSWGSIDIFFSIFNLRSLLQTALIVGGELMLCCSMVFPEGLPEKWFESKGSEPVYDAETGTYRQSAPGADLEFSMVTHVLLLLLLGAIWVYIWVYRVTKALNKTPGEAERNPLVQLLLCMFIPFYYIYWTYKSAQRIDKLAALNSIHSDISTLCLILAIFIGIIPPILMQDKMNAIAKAMGGSDYQPTYADPAASSWDDDADDGKYGDKGGYSPDPIPMPAPPERPMLADPVASGDQEVIPMAAPAADDDNGYIDDTKSMKYM